MFLLYFDNKSTHLPRFTQSKFPLTEVSPNTQVLQPLLHCKVLTVFRRALEPWSKTASVAGLSCVVILGNVVLHFNIIVLLLILAASWFHMQPNEGI